MHSLFISGSFKSQLIDYFRGHVTSCPKQVSYILIRTKWRLCMSWRHFRWTLWRSQLLCSWRNFFFIHYYMFNVTYCNDQQMVVLYFFVYNPLGQGIHPLSDPIEYVPSGQRLQRSGFSYLSPTYPGLHAEKCLNNCQSL